MTPHDFISKWRAGGDERRDAQPFFEDLCRLVRHPTPREADPEHTWFTYEYGAAKTSGGDGWADVWKKGCFGWEAKGTNRSLEKAYEQLKMYADALENPPLLVVSDLRTIVIHTNFTNTVKRIYRFDVAELDDFKTRQILEAVFHNPEQLRPGVSRLAVTQEAAEKFTDLATALREQGHAPAVVAHFLNRLLFCMFAEDIKLLPDNLFTKLVARSIHDPGLFEKRSSELFKAMNTGGDWAMENIAWFNGGLFDDDSTLRLSTQELKLLHAACVLDWSEIEPSIFGTLFERGLDPAKRSQLGAHYTDQETILKIVRPVVVEPWLREWKAEKAELEALLAKVGLRQSTALDTPAQKAAKTKALSSAQNRFNSFLERMRHFTVLDPACGSGNFLYLSLRALKDTEKQVLLEAEMLGLGRQFPSVGPVNVKGIELNTYAAELARVTIWIGEIQWMVQNGYGARLNPILQPLNQIENRDALLNPDGSEARWPAANVIVGNPPFVGDKKMMGELGKPYVTSLRKTYADRVPGGADLVCYWFEKANDAVRLSGLERAGLVATNSIRGGSNREVLKHIVTTSRIFEAWSDEAWINEGAAVRVSLLCFGKSSTPARLDGSEVVKVYADLTAGVDLTHAVKLKENAGTCFVGFQKTGEFDVDGTTARAFIQAPGNIRGHNRDVVFPYWNGIDVTRRNRDVWVIDFGTTLSENESSFYAEPFAHLKTYVQSARLNSPVKDAGAKAALAATWWRLWRPRPDLRRAWHGLSRVIVTPEVAKHRVFVWMPRPTAPDKNLMTTARDDDTSFGVLHSRIHEVWSLRMGTSLEDRPRYTPTTCFETFPFPCGLTPNIAASIYLEDPRAKRIAEAAIKLVDARDHWLNPPEWTHRQPEVVLGYPDRIMAKPGCETELKKRTLTNLYNAKPTWLTQLHHELDNAVAFAYGWKWPLSDTEILRSLFELNQERSNETTSDLSR